MSGAACKGFNPLAMIRFSLAALATLASVSAGPAAIAQQPPGAGAQVLQIPPPPQAPVSIPEIRIDRPEPPPAQGDAGQRVTVRTLRVSGQTLFSEAALVAAAGFTPGAEVTLSDLRRMAAGISHYYNARGYFVAQAYLPAQDIENGVVTIAVIEGHYGKIDLRNETRVADSAARAGLRGLQSGDPVANRPLERGLLLLSDIPGVVVNSTLSPGSAVGTSDLIVDLRRGRRVTGSLEADNAGNPYTGAYRVGGTVNLNNPLGRGDVASLRVLSSFSGLDYIRGSYQTRVGVLTAGVAYARVGYRLGRQFEPLQAHGVAEIASLYASYPLIRSYDNNLQVLGAVDAKSFVDEVDVTSTRAERKATAFRAGLSGDSHDKFGGGGWNVYAIGWIHGDLALKTPLLRAADALTARTEGGYDKFELNAARLQSVSGPLSLYVAVRGQLASGNLDVSEKMELGGAYGVRAYPEGEAYGDEGYLMSLEARLRLTRASASVPGDLQLFAFADTGAVTIADTPWFAGPNHASRSGAGVGAAWSDSNSFVLKATYAHRLGARATSVESAPGRVWVQLAKFF